MSADDWIVSQIDAERNPGPAILAHRAAQPDSAARANVLARKLGLPADVVERNYQEVEHLDGARHATQQVADHPYLAKWYSDPRNAAAARDDTATMRKLSENFQAAWKKPEPSFWDQVKAVPGNIAGALVSGAFTAASGLYDAAASYTDLQEKYDPTAGLQRRLMGGTIYDPVQRYLETRSKVATETGGRFKPDYGNMGFVAGSLYQGVESIPTSVAALGVGLAGQPGVGLGMLGASVYGQSYREGRNAGLSEERAVGYGAGQGAIEILTERIPVLEFLKDTKVGTPFFKRLAKNMVAEQIGEQAATAGQDFNTWASIEANQGKTFGDYLRERPKAALATALAVASTVGATNIAVTAGERASSAILRSQGEAAQLDAISTDAAASKLRTRDPEALRQFMAGLSENTPQENVYIPAEAIRELMQDGYRDHEFFGDYAPQIDEALALDGDVVLPTADVASRLIGTRDWDSLKPDARFSPGGMSAAELASLESSHADMMERVGAQAAEQADAAQKAAEPAAQVYQDIRDQLSNAGYAPDAADRYAQLWTANRETWAARLGTDALSYHRANLVQIQRVLPEALGRVQAADGLDLVINAMRKDGDIKRGPSLLEFISKRGGMTDAGGDLASMGANDWHNPKRGGTAFRKRLIRPVEDQGGLVPTEAGTANGPDDTLQAAIEAGYFPELQVDDTGGATFADKVDTSALYEAISEELAGRPRHADDGRVDQARAAATELRGLLESRGIDPDTASPKAIKDAVAAYSAESADGGRALNQITPEQAMETNVPVELPSDPLFAEAVQNTPGATITPDGLLIPLVRVQKPEQEGRYSVRTGVFYLPEGSANLRHYKRAGPGTGQYYGGSEQFKGETLIRRPLFVKGATGGKAPEAAYDALLGKGSIKKLDEEIGTFIHMRSVLNRSDPGLWEERVDQFLNEHGVENLTAYDVHAVSQQGNQLRYALRELVIAHAIRDAGYDAMVGYSRGKNGATISEVFDVREQTYPSRNGDSEVHDRYYSQDARGRATLSDQPGALIELFEKADLSTLAHESAHVWLEEFKRNASRVDTVRLYRGQGDLTSSRQGTSKEGHLNFTTDPEIAANYAQRNPNGEVSYLDIPADEAARYLSGHLAFVPEAVAANAQPFTDLATARSEAMRNGMALTPDDYKAHVRERAAALPNNGSGIVADWQTVKDWFAANGHPVGEDGVIPTEAHELWARGTERYFLEGKAPSSALRSAFDAFRGWLLTIYKHVRNLNVELTPEVRGVFDRMLATQDAIEAERQNQDMRLAFDATQLGMSDAEYGALQKLAGEARSEAFDALLYKTMATIRAARTKAWKDERAGVEREVTDSVNRRPDFRALELLRTGKWLGEPEREAVSVKLDRAWLVENFGEDVLSLMPKSVPPIYTERGVDADTVAEMVGYRSGNEMVHALIGIETARRELRDANDKRTPRAKLIADQTDEIMRDRHGDPLSDGSIEEEALAAIHNDLQGEVIATEARMLGRKTGNTPTPYKVARDWARQKIATGKVADVISRSAIQQYSRAVAKAARSAEAAMLSGDVDETFRQKQSQMLNHALLVEAKKAADDVDSIVARLSKLARKRGSKTIDSDYFGRIHEILERYDFRPRSQASINEQEGFEQWAAGQAAQGREVVVPARLGREQHYTRMAVEELRGLSDVVKSLETLGRQKQKMLDGKHEREWSDLRGDLYDTAEASQPDRVEGTERNRPEKVVAEALAAGWKIETLADVLDGGTMGAWNRLLVERATDAENHRDALREQVLVPIAKRYNGLPAEMQKRLQQRIDIPELHDSRTGQPSNMTRVEFLAVILNNGNESNRDKMLRGEKWTAEGLDAAIARLASQEDFDLAQAMWDAVDSLKGQFFAVERAMTGVEPEAIAAREIVTPFGTYRGGYWPMKYDFNRSLRAEDHDKDLTANAFMSGVSTRAGAEQERTGYAAPVRLSVEDVLFGHVEKVITRISYAEYARDVMRVLKDQRLMDVVDRKVGPEVRRQLEPWIKRVVGTQGMDHNGLRFVERLARSARTGVSVVSMGLRFKTGLAQAAGLTSSAGVIGPQWLARGVARYATERGDAWQFIADRSPEMVRRTESVNREVADAFRGIRGHSDWKAKAQAIAFWHIGMADRHMVAGPTWIGAHERGLSEGMTDEQASRYADKAVRKSQGANRAKDLSAWQAPSSETMKWLYMFSSYFAQQHQAVIEAKYAARKGDYARAFQRTFWFMAMAPLAGALLSGDLPDDRDELSAWMEWVALKLGVNMFASLPVIRDVANVAERKITGKFAQFNPGPLVRIEKSVEDVSRDLWAVTFGDGEPSDRWLQHAIETPGYFLALPTGQVAATSQFLWDTWNGDADPKTTADWYNGLTTGRVEKKKN